MRLLLMALALAAWFPAARTFAATAWQVNPAASRLTWTVPFNRQPVSGQFEKWSARIAFDPADLATSRITVTVDLASVSSADADRDATLKGPDFFNTAATSTATFTSDKITRTSQGYVAAGHLTLGGVTKPLALPFTVDINGGKASARGKIQLSRGAFGIGRGPWQSAREIADLVEVTILIDATALPPK